MKSHNTYLSFLALVAALLVPVTMRADENFSPAAFDARIRALSEPNQVANVARLQKLYFDALLKEGFTREEAITILTGIHPLFGGSK